MREIKFRAWDKATQGHWQPKPKGMIEFRLHNVPDYIGHTFNENGGVWERRFTVMQYTGLKDKNGREIYDGDIVQDDHDEYLWIVRFDDRGCFVAHVPGEECDWVLLDDFDFNVIGNIYENPELLEAN
jgi:uncharacterized phage protein (TIGR01671 family)